MNVSFCFTFYRGSEKHGATLTKTALAPKMKWSPGNSLFLKSYDAKTCRACFVAAWLTWSLSLSVLEMYIFQCFVTGFFMATFVLFFKFLFKQFVIVSTFSNSKNLTHIFFENVWVEQHCFWSLFSNKNIFAFKYLYISNMRNDSNCILHGHFSLVLTSKQERTLTAQNVLLENFAKWLHAHFIYLENVLEVSDRVRASSMAPIRFVSNTSLFATS